MKVAVVCANGKVGSLVVKDALKKGLDVTAVVRGENKSEAKNVLVKDVFDLTKEDLKDFDVVVDAFGAWTPETIPGIGDAVIHLADVLKGTNTKLVVVGGAGSLYVNKEHTLTVEEGPDFPESWKPLSQSHGRGLAYLRNTTDLNWLYISPAANFVADSKETGEYKVGGEELMVNSNGQSELSYADYALALVDELISGKHNKERISVCSK